MVGVSNNPTTYNEREDKKMERKSLLDLFFDNIDKFNEKGCKFIKLGEIEKAIEIYIKKIDYIRYAYEFNVIDIKVAVTMTDDTKRLIDILS